MSEHRDIWLQPWCPSCATFSDEGRQWCQDDVWERCEDCEAMPVRFVRQDIADAEIERLRTQIDAAVRELGKQGRELGKVEADNAALREALGDLVAMLDRNQRPGSGSDVPVRIRQLLADSRDT